MKSIYVIYWENGFISIAAEHSQGAALKQRIKDHPEDEFKDVRDIKNIADLALYQLRDILDPVFLR